MEQYTFVVDVDGTLCSSPLEIPQDFDLENVEPISRVVEKVREVHSLGHKVIIFTARGMKTTWNDPEKLKNKVLPTLTRWLHKNQVPYDEIILGKPWGENVYYVDDRSLLPDEFINFSL